MILEEILNNIHPLSSTSKTLLSHYFSEEQVNKNAILMNDERVEQYLYFIKKGIVRAYTSTSESDITFWFGLEGDVILSMQSYIHQQKSYETIEALEDGILYKIALKDLEQLYNSSIEIANWGRKLAEYELLKTEQRFIDRLCGTAKERYEALIQKQPEIIQKVQLGYVASYLGITQVSLSRIRSEVLL